jgi:hypothetical protein
MNVTIDELIILAGGAFLSVWGIGKISERRKLLKTGVKVEGVVFQLEKLTSFGKKPSTLYYPVIRYVTLDKEWITEKYGVGTNPSAYKEGEIVKVIYDPADYKHFIIDDFMSKALGIILIAVGALLIIGVFIYYILNQYQAL